MRGRRWLLVLLVGAAFGCVAAPSEEPASSVGAPGSAVPVAQSPVVAEPPDECYTISYSGQPVTVETSSLLRQSALVARATVLSIEKSLWTTADGSRPSKDEVLAGTAHLVTPVRVGGVEAMRGSLVADDRILLLGGTDGCVTQIYHDELTQQNHVEIGSTYLFLLRPGSARSGAALARGSGFEPPVAVFPVTDGIVETANGPMAEARLEDVMAKNPLEAAEP